MTQTSPLPPLKPLGDGPAYENVRIWLPQLFAEQARAGRPAIENKTFDRCQFEGPAVLLALDGNTFSACNMGDPSGDIRNLLLAPVGPQKVSGVIPVRNCIFRDCAFYMVGFTGSPAFLQHFQEMLTESKS